MDEIGALLGRAERLEERYCALEAALRNLRFGKRRRRQRRQRRCADA